MGIPLKLGNTSQPLLFKLYSSADHISPLTGVAPTVKLSKNGGGFDNPAGGVSEVGNGVYKVAAHATDANTLGPLWLYATAAGADPCDVEFNVVAYDPQASTNLGLTRLDAAITSLPSAANIAVAVWNYLTANITTPNSIGLLLKDRVSNYLNASLGLIQQSVTRIELRNQLNAGAIGAIGFLGFFNRGDYPVPDANSLAYEEATGAPVAVGQYVTLAKNFAGDDGAIGQPGSQSGLLWQITVVNGQVLTMLPVGHATTVQAYLGDDNTVCQGTLLSPIAPLAGSQRSLLALPNSQSNTPTGLPIRNWFASYLNLDMPNAATTFLSMVQQVGGIWRFLASALSQAPTGSGGGGPVAPTTTLVIVARVGSDNAAGCGCSSSCSGSCGGSCGACSGSSVGQATLTWGDTTSHPLRLENAADGTWLDWSGYSVHLWSDVEDLGEVTMTVTDSANLYARFSISSGLWALVSESGGLYFLKVMDGTDEVATVRFIVDPEGSSG